MRMKPAAIRRARFYLETDRQSHVLAGGVVSNGGDLLFIGREVSFRPDNMVDKTSGSNTCNNKTAHKHLLQ